MPARRRVNRMARRRVNRMRAAASEPDAGAAASEPDAGAATSEPDAGAAASSDGGASSSGADVDTDITDDDTDDEASSSEPDPAPNGIEVVDPDSGVEASNAGTDAGVGTTDTEASEPNLDTVEPSGTAEAAKTKIVDQVTVGVLAAHGTPQDVKSILARMLPGVGNPQLSRELTTMAVFTFINDANTPLSDAEKIKLADFLTHEIGTPEAKASLGAERLRLGADAPNGLPVTGFAHESPYKSCCQLLRRHFFQGTSKMSILTLQGTDEDIVAFAIFECDKRDVYIHQVVARRPSNDKDVTFGRTLVSALLASYPRCGFVVATRHCLKHTAPFWLKMGFKMCNDVLVTTALRPVQEGPKVTTHKRKRSDTAATDAAIAATADAATTDTAIADAAAADNGAVDDPPAPDAGTVEATPQLATKVYCCNWLYQGQRPELTIYDAEKDPDRLSSNVCTECKWTAHAPQELLGVAQKGSNSALTSLRRALNANATSRINKNVAFCVNSEGPPQRLVTLINNGSLRNHVLKKNLAAM